MISFRKSKKFGPFRLTASTRGLSLSGGVPGARASINTKGQVRRTVSIPGTGIYDTQKVADLGSSPKRRQKSADSQPLSAADLEGVISVTTEGGLIEVPEGTKYIHIQPAKGMNRAGKVWMWVALVATSLWILALVR